MLVNELYSKNFNDFNEVQEFFAGFSSVKEAITEAQKADIFYFDENTPLDPFEQWEVQINRSGVNWENKDLPEQMQGPNFLLFTLFGRMMQANSVVFGASVYAANPLITAPVSFHWLSQKIRITRNLVTKSINLETDLNLAKTNALLSKNLKWLSNVPIESLMELRKKGELSEIRSVINRETERLANTGLENLELIANQVDYNLATALEKHHEEIEKLDRSFRTEMSILLPTLLLSVAGAMQPQLVPLGPQWATVLSSVIGTTSLSTIIPATINYLKEKRTLGKSPIGILWHAKEDSQ